jgi:glycosyltransferase involved in cell wall biosynthesis
LKSLGIGVANTSNRAFGQLDRFVDRFLVLSDFAAELCRRSGLDDAAIVRHDNFVPDPGPRRNPAMASQTVIAVGRLSPEKGFAELIEAWNRARPKDLDLQIIGDGPERQRLEELAGPSVELVGRRSSAEVAELMRSSRALVFPSRWFEGQPLVVLEALAAGLPIISSDHPPLREIIDGASQLAVDHDGWPAAFRALDDDRWLEEASRGARSRFDARFSERVALDRLIGIYRSVQR